LEGWRSAGRSYSPRRHNYGGSITTEAGVHPTAVGLGYVAAHAPDVGEDEAVLAKKTPSVLAKTEGAIKVTPERFHIPQLGVIPQTVRARSAPRARGVRHAVLGFHCCARIQHAANCGCVEGKAELGNCRRRRPDHQSRSRTLVLRTRQKPHDRHPGRQPFSLRIPSEGSGGLSPTLLVILSEWRPVECTRTLAELRRHFRQKSARSGYSHMLVSIRRNQ
jgi:hypothetical protein